MTEPDIAALKPCLVTLKRQGRIRYWCACGRSKKQPFCDGSHQGSGFEPLAFAAREDNEEVLLCACKRTKNPPYCDGSHNSLEDAYQEADAAERLRSAPIPVTPPDEARKAMLDGGCFVISPDRAQGAERGGWRIAPLITPADGAAYLSHYLLESAKACQPLQIGDSEAALFVLSGSGRLRIGDRVYEASPETGLYIRPGEAFSVEADGAAPVRLAAVICPTGPEPTPLDRMTGRFDDSAPERLVRVDPLLRRSMADRFYQVLVGERIGSSAITQFIGEIPRSRAAAHRHLYEETITILAGEGYMWTENRRAAVRAGDVIFLPRKQLHSLECVSEGGLRLMGAFYPAGSPAINY